MGVRYEVECQDAAGRKLVVTVVASTDEQASRKALEALNSWRVLRPLPIGKSE